MGREGRVGNAGDSLRAMMMPVARTKTYETMDAQSSIPH
jgi:hypothetical protein